MHVTLEKLQSYKSEISRIAANYHANNIRVFGSVVRGESYENSDIDLLVTFQSGASLLDQAGLISELEGMLGTTVDVVSDRALNRHLSTKILNEAQPL
ncbi:MAG: nucleotidyltransferase family protein [Gammaproteobacteria bacterium]|nr:nucleotidyltransferase family protein [Gammaproteobacteria bacterium]